MPLQLVMLVPGRQAAKVAGWALAERPTAEPTMPASLRLTCSCPPGTALFALPRYVKDRSLGQQLGRARFTAPEDR